jgi:hypothetical protein
MQHVKTSLLCTVDGRRQRVNRRAVRGRAVASSLPPPLTAGDGGVAHGMHLRALHLSAWVFVGLFAVGCPTPTRDTPDAGNNDPPDVPGILNGRCIEGGFCNDGLVCVEDVCIDDPGAEGEGEGEGEGEAPCPDADRDGSCDDDDCDDADSSTHPGANERCDFDDDDCDGDLNDGLDCTFLAHSRDTTYAVDPFARTVTLLRPIDLPGTDGLLDVDRDIDDRLLAVTRGGIWVVNIDGSLSEVTSIAAPDNTNGMAITDTGELFLTNDDGADSAAWRVDRTLGDVVRVGGFSEGYVSSGDVVFTKTGDLLMSAKRPSEPDAADVLVEINRETGATTTRGSLGFARVFGLSDAFGFLFGVTRAGEVLLIDPTDGSAELLFTTPDAIAFAGAANGPL